MNTRAEKYRDNNLVGSRVDRNNNLYKDISKKEIESYDLRSNATVIGNSSGNNIDIKKIKSILDTHYNEVPKRRTIQTVEPIEKTKVNPIFETKEYDINVIIDKARETKEDDYAVDRSKKLHDTQYDILSNLNIDPKDYVEDYEEEDTSNKNQQAQHLQELINTITLNEKEISKKQEPKVENKETTDALDIYKDLKGSENTTVLEGLQEKTEQMINEIEKTTAFDTSFFTKTDKISKNDFDDFKDVDEKTPIGIKIVIALLAIAFIVGIIILVKTFL